MTPDFASQLCAAICEAFTIDELSRLLRLRMGVDFDDIRPHPSTREEAVFALVEWARRENRVPELLRAVAGERPSRQELASLRDEYDRTVPGGAIAHSGPRFWSRVGTWVRARRRTLLAGAALLVFAGAVAVAVNRRWPSSQTTEPREPAERRVVLYDPVVEPLNSITIRNTTSFGAEGHEKTIRFKIGNVSTQSVTIQLVELGQQAFEETGGRVFEGLTLDTALGPQVDLVTLDLARLGKNHREPLQPVGVLTDSKLLPPGSEREVKLSVFSAKEGRWTLFFRITLDDGQRVDGPRFHLEIRS